jgi:hypothetical protein
MSFEETDSVMVEAAPVEVVNATTSDDQTAVDQEGATEPPKPVTEPCGRCEIAIVPAEGSRHRDGRLLCAACLDVVCAECGREGRDVMRRSLAGTPVLCVTCCAQHPGREWMRRAAAGGEEGAQQ